MRSLGGGPGLGALWGFVLLMFFWFPKQTFGLTIEDLQGILVSSFAIQGLAWFGFI